MLNAKHSIEECSDLATSTEFIETQHRTYNNRKALAERRTNGKLDRLLITARADNASEPVLNEKAILNVTRTTIPREMEILISMGPKFALPVQHIHPNTIYHFIADIESILRTCPDKEIQDRNRCLIGTRIQNYLSRPQPETANTLTRFYENASLVTKKFLAENPELCIVESDKGKRMVIMRLADYDTKMSELLNDSTYKELMRDPTTSIQNANNNIVKRLVDLKLIDKQTMRKLQTQTSICPRIYGQPKAHKPNLPLRPVVPNITAPTYQTSKFIANILQATFNSKYNIKDSFSFVEYIKSASIPPEHILVSFDVVSLFTNISIDRIIQSIIHRWKDIKQGTQINLDLFLEMVELCVNNSCFRFRDKYYQQTFGTAMGSPLSPILADYVMEDLLDVAKQRLSFTIPILKKYVDDLFLVLPKTEVQNTLDVFNEYDQHIQFTVELEKNGSLPFLDTIVIHREDGGMNTKWYSKPISSGRLLNYHSFHPTTMKLNVANNLIKRITQLTTSTSIEQQKHTIFQILRQNNYPSSLINRLINRLNNNHPTRPASMNDPPIININQSSTLPSLYSHRSLHHHNNQQSQQSRNSKIVIVKPNSSPTDPFQIFLY
ncbi:uncharacterized protein LOC134202820 [Armigeres subalbatus]|uniref:uncharacterized protein LOC134202820 n=1 Tax=Armigeres subalbatus TaxID=124917 RepID=UPI002ED2D021